MGEGGQKLEASNLKELKYRNLKYLITSLPITAFLYIHTCIEQYVENW
jgi:hypothetical protein